MDSVKSFSCVLLGGQTLLIQCGDLLLERGHRIDTVVSADDQVEAWARERKIRFLAPSKTLADELKGHEFDYLFSIVNLSLVPDAVLALPKKGAINFHDGPLPDYAGLNTPVWAILNQREEHGVTWHEMLSKVDQGDIYRQARFPLQDDDTVFAVNARCFQYGFETFGELIEDLENDQLERRSQDLSIQQYFGRHDRPAHGAVIDWTRPAEAISALIRALDTGPYPNPVSTAKVALQDRWVIVKGVQVEEEESTQAPGTVLDVSGDGLTIATGSRNIRLSDFRCFQDGPQDPSTWGLVTGDILPALSDADKDSLTRITGEVSRYEAFWMKRLGGLEPIELPYAKRQGNSVAAHYQSLNLSLAQSLDVETVVTALALYFSRIGGKDSFDLAYQGVASQARAAEQPRLVFATVPLHIDVEFKKTFAEFKSQVAAEIATTESKVTYLRDLLPRYGDLRQATRHWHTEAASVLIVRGDKLPETDADLAILVPENGNALVWRFNAAVLPQASAERMLAQFNMLVLGIIADTSKSIAHYSIISEAEARTLLSEWNQTETNYLKDVCIHQLFEQQVQKTPDSTALVFREKQLTYRELNEKANQVAHELRGRGVRAGNLVGVMLDRSDLMIIAMMGVIKAGAAYVPLDPTYPRDRLGYMVEDAEVAAVLTRKRFTNLLPNAQSKLIEMDLTAEQIALQPTSNPLTEVKASDLMYTIYTSGSTGKPKGVMIEHRNCNNFFIGMDERLGTDPGVWLAVTSISFDISVLEIFWTLTRGYKVVLYSGDDKRVGAGAELQHAEKSIQYSLFYFASDEGEKARNKYAVLLDGARFADEHGFVAVWTPERHFGAFGGLYPSPAVASAAIATITKNIQIRSGSVVLPLHSPIRVAEEWALVDNLSNGRVGISFASGWHPNDFAIMPQNYNNRNQVMYESIETVRRLWRGEKVKLPGPNHSEVEISTLPRPVQPELPFWVTAAGNPETFRSAGKIGANMLTHLLGQSIEELAPKIEIYRQAWRDAGHPGNGHVSLMLHTFVSDNEAYVKEQAWLPLKRYLSTAAELIKQHASTFPAFKQTGGEAKDIDAMFASLGPEDVDALLEHAVARYYETSGLFGTPESCLPLVDKLKGIGVDEIGCLIDYGIPSDVVLANLPHLNALRQASEPNLEVEEVQGDYSIPALISRHAVTHLQCTPSQAGMLVADHESHDALRTLQHWMVGGEAFPLDLANQLKSMVPQVTNMYGPTETTIWSATHAVANEDLANGIPLGKPIANTQIYVLDQHLQLNPIGVPGELIIAGDGVVRGYLNRPQLTAEKFLFNPFRPGERMYRTGDLARYREDGRLEFLGRIDHQVKIRGYRIELGEIEAAIATHETVKQAIVLLREDTPGDKRLVAYVVMQPGQLLQEEAVRSMLRARMPEFMVPSAFIVLDKFPLTPNGKIDRKQLPKPTTKVVVEASSEYVQPENELEQLIADVWAAVLNRPKVGLNDNFFDLGGHSLLTVQVLTQLRTRVKKPIQMTDLFKYTTVAKLAAFLSDETEDKASVQAGKSRAEMRKAMRRR